MLNMVVLAFAPKGVLAQPVFPANHKRPNVALSVVVVNLYSVVLDISVQIGFLLVQIINLLIDFSFLDTASMRFLSKQDYFFAHSWSIPASAQRITSILFF